MFSYILLYEVEVWLVLCCIILQKTFVASGTNFVRLTKATTARFEQ